MFSPSAAEQVVYSGQSGSFRLVMCQKYSCKRGFREVSGRFQENDFQRHNRRLYTTTSKLLWGCNWQAEVNFRMYPLRLVSIRSTVDKSKTVTVPRYRISLGTGHDQANPQIATHGACLIKPFMIAFLCSNFGLDDVGVGWIRTCIRLVGRVLVSRIWGYRAASLS